MTYLRCELNPNLNFLRLSTIQTSKDVKFEFQGLRFIIYLYNAL